ncbi:hypothetical protein V494_08159 [Pseudogymnoascus sp. VKM F-4513 (FW-928)]|nr:hypothetical protein V494_08159 [Pseudogymnoascus sp. VKM F-4513 (FW-928)]
MGHTVMDNHIDFDRSWITVMCRATRFHITISRKDIQRSSFEMEYSEMVVKAIVDHDGEDFDVLCEWMVNPCLSYFRENTSNVSKEKELTFQDYYYPSTHHLKLLVSESLLYPKATRDRGTMDPFYYMTPSADLPPFPSIPRSKASDLRIVSDPKWDDYMSEIPQKAIIADGTLRFFKPADKKTQLEREVDMHLLIRDAGLQDKIKVPNLHSIVVSDDGKMTIGLLLDLIPSGGDSLSLYSYQHSEAALEHRARWKQQVTDTVKQLHAHDLVWGDVHPGNSHRHRLQRLDCRFWRRVGREVRSAQEGGDEGRGLAWAWEDIR